ncbi:MAG: hypothetical protein CMM33_02475, partial [Rhodospirillaceae bacterium]|nr:hypothetical protein [Rhodospirillaceae bacterium]
MAREVMEYDVVIVGAGPSGLAAAIRLRQLAKESAKDISVCVLEKGSEVGAHILSGAVIETRALEELLPNWRKLGAPLNTPVSQESLIYLSEKKSFKFPFIPPQMRNRGNYIVSLGNLCRWMAEQAELLGVEIYPGFPATEVLYDDSGAVIGDATYAVGPPTPYAPNIPFANIEYDVSHTSTPLQAIAGGGTREALSAPSGFNFPGLYIGALTSTEILDGSGDSQDPKQYANTWSINNTGGRTQASITRILTFTTPGTVTDGDPFPSEISLAYTSVSSAIIETWFPQAD